MPVTLPAPELAPGPRSALVIATGSYTDERLGALRAPALDAAELIAVLRDPRIGNFAVTVFRNRSVHELRMAVEDFLADRKAQEIVLVYLSCHGLLSSRRRLYFAAADTDRDRLASTGLDSRWLIECLDECRARRQVMILDCCFSGAFALTKSGKGSLDVGLEEQLGLEEGRGRVVLTASRATEYSFEGEPLDDGADSGSVFTEALVEGLRTGAADLDRDGLVSISEAYEYVYRRVRASGGSQTPQRWVYGGEGDVMIARSVAGLTVEPAALPEELQAGLENRYPGVRVGAVEELAGWLADADPARQLAARAALQEIAEHDVHLVAQAARAHIQRQSPLPRESPHSVPEMGNPPVIDLLRGERLADLAADALPAITDENVDSWKVERVVTAVAGIDPQRAERIALTIADEEARASLLEKAVKAVAGMDPQRAERIARTFTKDWRKAFALDDVVKVIAGKDPQRAERIALSISLPRPKAEALVEVAKVVAESDPRHAQQLVGLAERAALAITDEGEKAWALGEVAKVIAGSDPQRAERLLDQAERTALRITDEDDKARALTEVAVAMLRSDPQRAERLFDQAERAAAAMSGDDSRVWTLYEIAKVMAGSDPQHAEHVARIIPEDDWRRSSALTEVAKVVAASDPQRAERIALTITGESGQSALTEVAKVVAASDPQRAERIALTITGVYKAWAFAGVAKAVAASDPQRAERLFDQAENAALATTEDNKAWTLAQVAEAMARSDPQRAERLFDQAEHAALVLPDEDRKAEALATILEALSRVKD